jgi:glycosyltransferase involved in cell wall biosynthesis
VSFNTGGVNVSRRDWAAAMVPYFGQVMLVDAARGYRAAAPPGVVGLATRHTGRRRMTMIPHGLPRLLRAGDVLVLHEGWTPSNLTAARAAVARGVPYVVMPHGVYEPQVVENLRMTRPRRHMERWLLEHAVGVHVFFDGERAAVHEICPTAQTIVAPTGIDAALLQTPAGRDAGGFCWYGRYDIYHKGLDLLIGAWTSLDPSERPSLRLFGPDHSGGRVRVERMVAAAGLRRWVTVSGPLTTAEQRDDVLKSAAAFIHPARWEAYGHAIIDAIAAGTPVLVARSCRIAPELERAGAATTFNPTASDLATAVRLFSPAEARTQAAAATRYVQAELDWRVVSQRFAAQLTALVS